MKLTLDEQVDYLSQGAAEIIDPDQLRLHNIRLTIGRVDSLLVVLRAQVLELEQAIAARQQQEAVQKRLPCDQYGWAAELDRPRKPDIKWNDAV